MVLKCESEKLALRQIIRILDDPLSFRRGQQIPEIWKVIVTYELGHGNIASALEAEKKLKKLDK